MNDNTNNHNKDVTLRSQAEHWLTLSCPSSTDVPCNVSELAARELGRRTGYLPLAVPLVMAVILLASPLLLPYWPPIAVLFAILLGGSLVQVHLGKRLAQVRGSRGIDLAFDYQAGVDLAAFCWSALLSVLLLVQGIDRFTELALVATFGLVAGAYATLTLERSLWLHFSIALWLPLWLAGAVLAATGASGAELLLLVLVLAGCGMTIQGLRMVHNNVGNMITRARLEVASSKIVKQRSELNAHRMRLDELVVQTHQLSYYDQLTGLGSRHHFHERVCSSIASHGPLAQRFAVLHMDLDGFKDINDTFGHAAGDELLKVVAQRAGSLLRATDFAARLGSDELALLLNNIDDDDEIGAIAQRCSDVIQAQVTLGDRCVRPRVSIGIAVYPDDGDNALALIKAAESAMNACRSDSKSNASRYRPEMTRAAEQRLTAEQELRQGLELGQFVLHYQPQFDARNGSCGGVEALVRWNHPQRGMIAPLEFIPIAENAGLIDALGTWVLSSACRQAVAWFDNGVAPMTIAVNISPLQLRDPDLVSTVGNILAVTGLQAELLELEITESALQTHADARSNLNLLHELGVRIALDDFGTGYSSLASLRELPIDRVKIDRSFVADILSNKQDSALLGTIIEMAHILGSSIIAEGVEQHEQAELLRKLHCDCLQGFHFSEPVPADQVLEIAGRARPARQPTATLEMALASAD